MKRIKRREIFRDSNRLCRKFSVNFGCANYGFLGVERVKNQISFQYF